MAVLLETIHVPAVFLSEQSILAMYSYRQTTGIVGKSGTCQASSVNECLDCGEMHIFSKAANMFGKVAHRFGKMVRIFGMMVCVCLARWCACLVIRFGKVTHLHSLH